MLGVPALNPFTEQYAIFAVLLMLGFLIGNLLRKIRLSPAIGYLVAGLIVGLLTEIPEELSVVLTYLSEISILLLFFEIGFEIHVTKLKQISSFPLYLSLFEMSIAIPLTIGTCIVLGLDINDALILGLIASFSSTIFTYKLLEECKPSGNGVFKTVLMVAAVEDVVIVIALAMIQGINMPIHIFVIEVVALSLAIFFLSLELVERVFSRVIKPDDTGLILLISYGLLLGLITTYLGLGPALGAFIAGVTLSSLKISKELMRMFKPVRAVFLTLFLIFMGLNISSIHIDLNSLSLLILLSLIMCIIHTFSTITSSVMVSGLGIRQGMEAGLYLSTISELSLVIAYYAISAGIASPYVLTISALAITFASLFSSSFISVKDDIISKFLGKVLGDTALLLDDVTLRFRRLVEGYAHKRIQHVFKTILHNVGEILIMLLIAYTVLSEIYIRWGLNALILSISIGLPIAYMIIHRLIKRTELLIHELLVNISKEFTQYLETLIRRFLFTIVIVITIELALLIAIFRYSKSLMNVLGKQYLGLITLLISSIPLFLVFIIGIYMLVKWRRISNP